MALLLAGGAIIGFLLAVFGAGGSILPLLVSGTGLPTRAAVPLSLLVVTLLALGNVGPYLRRRQIAVGPALVLGVPVLAGVGGGFAIVPALVLMVGLPMPLASGTSLVLIATNSMVALTALGHWPAAELPLLVPLVGGGLAGALVGQRLAPHLPENRLRQGFSALLIGSALLTGFEAWRRHTLTPTISVSSP
jgi:uncharacterized membrane protein YfcA